MFHVTAAAAREIQESNVGTRDCWNAKRRAGHRTGTLPVNQLSADQKARNRLSPTVRAVTLSDSRAWTAMLLPAARSERHERRKELIPLAVPSPSSR
jgi:hypothetical protein